MVSSQSWTGLDGPQNTFILDAFNSLLHNSWQDKPESKLTRISTERDGGDTKKAAITANH